MSTIIQGVDGDMSVDFESKTISLVPNSIGKMGNRVNMEINFSDITAIEYKKPSIWVKSATCNFIIKGNRYTTDGGADMATVSAKDAKMLENTLAKILEECNLSSFHELKSVVAPKVNYKKALKSKMEIRKKCRLCGHVFCYSENDVEENERLKGLKSASTLGALGSALSGNVTNTNLSFANRNSYDSRIRDFDACPKCNSHDLITLTQAEYEDELKAKSKPEPSSPVVQALSSAEELKKFKELLDMGIITQEEFDAKKKQLLGL